MHRGGAGDRTGDRAGLLSGRRELAVRSVRHCAGSCRRRAGAGTRSPLSPEPPGRVRFCVPPRMSPNGRWFFRRKTTAPTTHHRNAPGPSSPFGYPSTGTHVDRERAHAQGRRPHAVFPRACPDTAVAAAASEQGSELPFGRRDFPSFRNSMASPGSSEQEVIAPSEDGYSTESCHLFHSESCHPFHGKVAISSRAPSHRSEATQRSSGCRTQILSPGRGCVTNLTPRTPVFPVSGDHRRHRLWLFKVIY